MTNPTPNPGGTALAEGVACSHFIWDLRVTNTWSDEKTGLYLVQVSCACGHTLQAVPVSPLVTEAKL